MSTPEVEAVLTWHEALNAGDAERVASISHPEFEIGGPRGTARGRQILRDWVGRANIRLEPLRSFQRGRTVVVDEAAAWRDARTGETIGEATVATVFTLDGGSVSGIFRHDGLEEALRDAGLDGSDEIRSEQSNERIPMQSCTHLGQIRDVEPSAEGCEECLQMGDTWVHLRECLSCGHVGCCDSSKNKHATKHFRATEHPIVQSFQPGEDWIWCYVDEVVMEPRR